MDTEHKPYAHVNAAWPETVPSTLTGSEAITAFKRLYRIAMGKPWRQRVALTTGRRYTWPRGGVYYVNPQGHPWAAGKTSATTYHTMRIGG